MELHYDDECLYNGAKDETCFWIELTYNGEPFYFQDCVDQNEALGIDSKKCQYTDFLTYIDKVSISGDLEELCT